MKIKSTIYTFRNSGTIRENLDAHVDFGNEFLDVPCRLILKGVDVIEGKAWNKIEIEVDNMLSVKTGSDFLIRFMGRAIATGEIEEIVL